MANMTLAVPKDLHDLMRKHKEIKWSEVARRTMWEQARKLEFMDSVLSKSTLKEKEALYMGRVINKGIAKSHGLIR